MAKKSKKIKIKKSDLKGYSLDEMLTKSYGKKGIKKRKEAEKRISGISKDLAKNNKLKEKSEKPMLVKKKSFSKKTNNSKNWDKQN
ncbi:MAG TPA: hypothetical protein VN026_13455 [Bacteroidia bacterium]|jgi:hypothetical protein|nr:hypothetical protein [Bacteroidia bacterium]